MLRKILETCKLTIIVTMGTHKSVPPYTTVDLIVSLENTVPCSDVVCESPIPEGSADDQLLVDSISEYDTGPTCKDPKLSCQA